MDVTTPSLPGGDVPAGQGQPFVPDGTQPSAPNPDSLTGAPDAGGQQPDDGQQGGDDTSRPRATVEDRINELTRHRRTAERVAAEAVEHARRIEQENAQMRAYLEGRLGAQGQPGASSAPDANTDGPPDPAKYQDWGAYTRDLVAYETRQTLARSEQERATQAREQQRIQAEAQVRHAHIVREATLQTAVEGGTEKYGEEFVKALSNPQLPSLRAAAHPSVLDAVAYSEQAADLLYYFGKNPAEAHRIVGLHPTLAIREIGKLEAKLAAGTVQLTSAPAPVQRVRGGSNAPDPLSDRASIEDWMAARNKQTFARRV